jgi:hypothetical protein
MIVIDLDACRYHIKGSVQAIDAFDVRLGSTRNKMLVTVACS